MLKNFFLELNAFYHVYLRTHNNIGNQVFHFIGSIFLFTFLVLAFVLPNYWLIGVAIFAGYLFPGIGHHFFQHNESFRSSKPVLCVICAVRLFFDSITFRIKKKMNETMMLT